MFSQPEQGSPSTLYPIVCEVHRILPVPLKPPLTIRGLVRGSGILAIYQANSFIPVRRGRCTE